MLSKMTVKELRAVADEFGVDYSEAKTKKLLLATLAEEGVTDEMYAQFAEAQHEELPVKAEKPTRRSSAVPGQDEDVLVKMNRANPYFEILGHVFTSDHPYIAMSRDDAQDLFNMDPGGFAVATPDEVKNYYS